MASLADVYVSVMPDFSKLGPAVKRELPRHIPDNVGDDAGKRVGSRFGGAFLGGFKGIATGVGVALAGAGIANLFSSVIAEAREAGQVTRLTENAIRATGGAANVTASQVGKLAESISNKTGIDDEQVQASANLLLTFKNVRNELGAGNDVFDRATSLTQDLAAAGFGSAESASKMLGKALNDPIAGLTALGRAGVTFSKEQKEQIKTLVETGDVLGAQRIILDEVASQVGGAAAASADPIQKLGVIVDNLKEQMGTALLPVITSVAEWLGPKLVAGAEKLSSFFSGTLVPTLERVGAAFRTGMTEDEGQGFVGFLERVAIAARKAFDYFKSDILPRLQDFYDYIMAKVVPAIRDYLLSYLEGLRGWLNNVRDAVEENRPQLEKLGAALVNIGKWIIENVIPALAWLAEHWFPLLGKVIGGVIDVIGDIVTAVDTFIGWLETLANWINIAADTIRNLGTATAVVWEGIKNAFWDGTQTVIRFFLDLVGTIIQGAADAFGWVPGIGPKLQEAAGRFEDFKNSVNQSLAGVQDQDVSVTARLEKEGIDVSSFLGSTAGRLASGGQVSGPGTGTSDTAGLFRLSNKEWVIRADAAAKYGLAAMSSINNGTAMVIPGMARGGPAQFNVHANTAEAAAAAYQASREMSADIDATTARTLKELIESFTVPVGSSSAAGLQPYVAAIRGMITALFGITNIGGYSYRNIAGTNTLSDHATGRALDIMTTNLGLGNSIVSWLHKLPSLKYTIWQQRYFPKGGSPSLMANRGSPTQNHMDHVHASFFDNGAWVPPGQFVGYNATGKPERLTNTTEPISLSDASLAKLAALMRRGTDWALADVTAAHRAGARG